MEPEYHVKYTHYEISEANGTIISPTPLGALLQSYRVRWLLQGRNALPRKSRAGITEDLHPSLALINVGEENVGTYICYVTVTSPYDGQEWTQVGKVTVVIKLNATTRISSPGGGEKV